MDSSEKRSVNRIPVLTSHRTSLSRMTTETQNNNSKLPTFNRSGTYIIETKNSRDDSFADNNVVDIDNQNEFISEKSNLNQQTTKRSVYGQTRPSLSKPTKSFANTLPGENQNTSRTYTNHKKSSEPSPFNFNSDNADSVPEKSSRIPTNVNNLSLIKQKKREEIQRAQNESKLATGIKNIDLVIKNARKSGQLNLSDANLTEIPVEIWQLNENSQDLSFNKPRAASNKDNNNDNEFKWWDQVDLTKLILAANKIKLVPSDIKALSTLVTLDLHDNQIESIDEAIGELHSLKYLNISHNQLVAFPNNICKLTRLVSFNASFNKLKQLPKNFGHLDDLEDLDLSNNSLTVFPKSFAWLNKLQKLNLSTNMVAQLIPEVFSSSNLKIIDISENQLEAIPQEEIGSLINLEQLFCRQNRLKKFPILEKCCKLKDWDLSFNKISEIEENAFFNLASLVNLNLRDNQLTTIPKSIQVLQTLERLDVSNNNLSGLPYELATIESLKQILLNGNPLRSIRRDIINRGTDAIMKHLRNNLVEAVDVNEKSNEENLLKSDVVKSTKVFDISCKKLTSVTPSMISFCKQSTALAFNASKNQLKDLPGEFEKLNDQLLELNISFNSFTNLPDSMFGLINLTSLDLRNNQFTSLPNDISRLKALRELFISDNRLTEIPSGVYDLPILENLFANNNKITYIDPYRIVQMRHLSTLNLQNNDISQVPPALGKAKQIRSLMLEGNPFRLPRPQIVEKGTAAILEYLRGRLSES